jgi:hypothetical protein
MVRTGDSLYESEFAVDFADELTDLAERELAYDFSPEKVPNARPEKKVAWLKGVLPAFEMLLLFRQHGIGSLQNFNDPRVVQRWREAFLTVWDGDWIPQYRESQHYDSPAQRIDQRPRIIAIFDRLESIARYWEGRAGSNPPPESKLAPLTYSLPFYSIWRFVFPNGQERVCAVGFLNRVRREVEKEIIYRMSPESRAREQRRSVYDRDEALNYEQDRVWVAVHVLAIFCETYEQSPGYTVDEIRRWREVSVESWKQFVADDKRAAWDDSAPLYLNVMQLFDRLEAVAEKYPPI